MPSNYVSSTGLYPPSQYKVPTTDAQAWEAHHRASPHTRGQIPAKATRPGQPRHVRIGVPSLTPSSEKGEYWASMNAFMQNARHISELHLTRLSNFTWHVWFESVNAKGTS